MTAVTEPAKPASPHRGAAAPAAAAEIAAEVLCTDKTVITTNRISAVQQAVVSPGQAAPD
jgi:hypothetical protein